MEDSKQNSISKERLQKNLDKFLSNKTTIKKNPIITLEHQFSLAKIDKKDDITKYQTITNCFSEKQLYFKEDNQVSLNKKYKSPKKKQNYLKNNNKQNIKNNKTKFSNRPSIIKKNDHKIIEINSLEMSSNNDIDISENINIKINIKLRRKKKIIIK